MSTLDDYHIPSEHLKMLNRMLKVVTTVLKHNNISYWADGGTLLGAIRNKGQIPWDDDCDIGVMSEDITKIEKIAHHFISFGYAVQKVNDDLWKVYIPLKETWTKTEHNDIGTPTLDIFAWQVKDTMVRLNDPNARREYPNCYHKINNLFPLKEYTFNDHSIMGPSNPIPYLNRMYSDWQTKAVVDIREYDDNLVTKKVGTVSFALA